MPVDVELTPRAGYQSALAAAGLIDIEIVERHRVHEHASAAIIRAKTASG